MREINFILRYFLITIFVHTFVKGIYYADHQSDASFQSSHRRNGNVSSQLYGTWSDWSHCSRSCGMGISRRTRACNVNIARSVYRDENLCHRESVEHKVCTLQLCPPGTPDLRAALCSRYNGRLVAGQRAKFWVPVHKGSNPCELRCEAAEERLVYGFGKVEDGTPCSGGLCVDGRCLKIGCDDKLGSHTEADMCGVCGGRNEFCVHYKDSYIGHTLFNGIDDFPRRTYHSILVLPVGARNFEISQKVGKNILAMRDRNMAVLLSESENKKGGKHKLAGTILTRYLTDSNNTEVYRAPGPTTFELEVLVVLYDKNDGIHYEYWLPKEGNPTQNFRTMKTTPYHEGNIHTRMTNQRFRTTHKPVWTPAARPTTASPVYYRTAGHTSAPPEQKAVRYGKSSSTFSNGTSTYAKVQHQSYGPKLKAPLFAAWSSGNHYQSARENPVKAHGQISETNDDQEDRFAARNGLIVPFLPNYRTPKPIYNYYEKFRNTTFRAPVNIYRQKPETTLQQTQRDSSDSDAKNAQETTAIPSKNLPKEIKTDVAYRDANVHNFGHGVRKPNSRWEYKFNGNKLNGTTLAEGHHNHPTTAVSISVLPLPEQGNHTKLRREKKITGKSDHHSKVWSSRKGVCGPCHKVKNQARHFCTSDFVIRASVLNYEFVHGETRYELQVLQSFKNTFSLLPREYVWSPNTCRCPKLRVGKEYVIMGRSDNNFRRNESRLLVDGQSFVRTYSLKHDRRLLKLRKNQAKKCASKIS